MEEPIVFFGTGPVAARSLRLLTQHFQVEAVVTKPRAEHHRGSVPVLELAEQLELPVVLAANKKEVSEKVAKAKFKSRVAVLIDFGIIVEQSVIDSFPFGIVNSHFSLLPQWRGNPQSGPGIGLVTGYVVVPHYDGKRGGWVRAGLATERAVLGIPECSGILVEAAGLRAVGAQSSSLITANGTEVLPVG